MSTDLDKPVCGEGGGRPHLRDVPSLDGREAVRACDGVPAEALRSKYRASVERESA